MSLWVEHLYAFHTPITKATTIFMWTAWKLKNRILHKGSDFCSDPPITRFYDAFLTLVPWWHVLFVPPAHGGQLAALRCWQSDSALRASAPGLSCKPWRSKQVPLEQILPDRCASEQVSSTFTPPIAVLSGWLNWHWYSRFCTCWARCWDNLSVCTPLSQLLTFV